MALRQEDGYDGNGNQLSTWIRRIWSPLSRRSIYSVARKLADDRVAVQVRAIKRLRSYIMRGELSTTTQVIESLDPALQDKRDWVRWNAINVLIDLGPINGRSVPEHLRTVLVDSDGKIRIDAAWRFAPNTVDPAGAAKGASPFELQIPSR